MVTGKPVTGKITGFNFRLPVTDLPTFFLHVMQFSTSSSSHTHTGEQRQAYIGPRATLHTVYKSIILWPPRQLKAIRD